MARSGQDAYSVFFVPLSFFSGQHSDWKLDKNSTPEELAMNLLLQLIDLGRRELDPSVLEQSYENMDPGDMASTLSIYWY